jgi:hypothetical protein
MGAVGALNAEVSEQLADLLETGLVREAQP